MSVVLDDILAAYIGEYGRYQKIVTNIILLTRALVAMLTADVVYLSLTPNTFCVDSDGNATAMPRNITTDQEGVCWCLDEKYSTYHFHYDLMQYGSTIVTEVGTTGCRKEVIGIYQLTPLYGILYKRTETRRWSRVINDG